MVEKLKAVIAGCGSIGFKSHAKILTSDDRTELVGISRTSFERAEKRAREISIKYKTNVLAYDDVGVMCKELNPDIVVIASPPEFHYDNFLSSLSCGSVTGLLIEKPLVYVGDAHLSLEKAMEIADICSKKGIFLDTTNQLEFVARDYFSNQRIFGEKKFFAEFPSTKKTAQEKWIDMGCHIVSMIEENWKLDENWAGDCEVKYDDSVFLLSGKARVEGDQFLLVDVKLGDRGEVGRRFGVGGVWDLGYDKERDGYVAEDFSGKEVSFIPDPMRQRYDDFLDKVAELKAGDLPGKELREFGLNCVSNLEKMLGVVSKKK